MIVKPPAGLDRQSKRLNFPRIVVASSSWSVVSGSSRKGEGVASVINSTILSRRVELAIAST